LREHLPLASEVPVKFVSLTPTPIPILVKETHTSEQTCCIPPSGKVATVPTQVQIIDKIPTSEVEGFEAGGTFPVGIARHGQVEGLPPEEFGTLYLVTPDVALALQESGRQDLYTPDFSDAHRFEKGHPREGEVELFRRLLYVGP
jgi:hypothetical protein